jgi:hypothetical protein
MAEKSTAVARGENSHYVGQSPAVDLAVSSSYITFFENKEEINSR